ncbi:hypothetical protein ES705_46960 [subsurface metagenome]
MDIIEQAMFDGFLMLLARVHIETCKECKKKYMEIVTHMKEEALEKEKEGKKHD